MNEKIFRTMKLIGASSIVLGIVMLVTGLACGTISLINGAMLIRKKSDIIF